MGFILARERDEYVSLAEALQLEENAKFRMGSETKTRSIWVRTSNGDAEKAAPVGEKNAWGTFGAFLSIL